ncbi:MAG: hypothetical protein EYC70_16405 [Planctomycetota bacterium]|nr:MAG: hypothetical protein EYC70_16405 [Planctomycetota bacterium]
MRELLAALRSVPAGGSVLCWGDAAAAQLLHERRRDRVTAADFDGRARLPYLDASFLAAVYRSESQVNAAIAAELCRLASRYAAVCYASGLLRARHRAIEVLFRAHGFRPLSRAARRLWLRPEWCAVYLRDRP